MKSLIFTTAVTIALASGASAFAEGPRASSGNTVPAMSETRAPIVASAAPRYEWRYHYVGHHARLEGYWALVK